MLIKSLLLFFASRSVIRAKVTGTIPELAQTYTLLSWVQQNIKTFHFTRTIRYESLDDNCVALK